ncbi:hypothetical protein ACFY12_17310 [Streptomyces sp. NPDC001339]|uniref:hypothetical protein n=1 Tax=Streptomyces sp. NPDC001339 TaxID=3364563 RepID=UPI00367CCD2F
MATIKGSQHRTPDTGHRTPDTGHRTPRQPDRETRTAGRPDTGPVFGLSPEWLLHDGRPLATATVLSHPEQLERLAAACPEAAPTAVLAGDPCYDRILDALPYRERFRRALGVTPEQRLIVLSSTWSPRSLFGDGNGTTDSEGTANAQGNGEGNEDDLLPWLLPRLTGELPADEYRTVAVLHPNIWYGHGPGQVRAWLDRARRAGLTLIPPLESWRQALIAADCVLGDHSSVTYYAASLGVPVLLGAFPQHALDPDSPVAGLGRTAPHLRRRGSLRGQIDQAINSHAPDRYAYLAAQTSSSPGESAGQLRRLFYGLIGVPEPEDRPALLEPLPLPSYAPAERTAPVQVLARLLGGDPPEIAVTRYADAEFPPEEGSADSQHIAVHEDTREPGRRSIADVILRYAVAEDPRVGPPAVWTSEVLSRHPYCRLAAYIDGPDRCTVRTRGGELVRLTAAPAHGGSSDTGRTDLCDPAAYASALHAWLSSGKSLAEASPGITVVTGTARHPLTVEPLTEAPVQLP